MKLDPEHFVSQFTVLSSLPEEIIKLIVEYLTLNSLLNFAITSKDNRIALSILKSKRIYYLTNFVVGNWISNNGVCLSESQISTRNRPLTALSIKKIKDEIVIEQQSEMYGGLFDDSKYLYSSDCFTGSLSNIKYLRSDPQIDHFQTIIHITDRKRIEKLYHRIRLGFHSIAHYLEIR